jgi:hypothetical protein
MVTVRLGLADEGLVLSSARQVDAMPKKPTQAQTDQRPTSFFMTLLIVERHFGVERV